MIHHCINCRLVTSLTYSKLDYEGTNDEGHSVWNQTVECQFCGWKAKLTIEELTAGE